MQYIFHIGAHKTAAALLQRNLSENLEELRAQGIYYVNAEMPAVPKKQHRLLAQLDTQAAETATLQPFRRMNRMVTRAAREAGAQTVLISGTHAIGPAMHEDLARGVEMPGFYPQASSFLEYVTAGLNGEDIQFLLYCRNPETYLLSLYSDAIRQNMTTLDIDSFCARLDLGSVDFAALKARVQATHPKAQVIMRQYERIKLGPEPYISTFLRDVGLDAKYAQPVMVPQQPPLDQSQVDALRHISFGDTSRRPQRIKRLRNRVLAHDPNPADPLTLPDWVRAALRRDMGATRRLA